MIINSDFSLSGDVAVMPIIGWHNLVTSSNIVSTTEQTDFPVANIGNPATHLKWRGGINTHDEYITVSPSFTGEIDYVGIVGHNFGDNDIMVSIEATTTNSPSDWIEIAPITTSVINLGDEPLLFRFAPTTVNQIRIRMIQSFQSPEIAVLYIGKLLQMERSIKVDIDHIPITLGRKTTVQNGMSESGHFVGRIIRNRVQESIAEFSHITPSWYRANFDPFVEAAESNPFFWAWHPETYPGDLGFGWLLRDPEPMVSPVTQRIAVALEMRAIA